MIQRTISTILFWLSLLLGLSNSSPPCHLYGCEHYYLPAPPGKTPPCAKPGKTYCENVEQYPTHVIQYLVERWQYDYNTLFTSERKENLKLRPTYGPPPFTGYHYEPKSDTPSFYDKPPSIKAFTSNFNQTQIHEGYPDRKYPLGNPNLHLLSDDPGFIYSAILHPELAGGDVTHYDPGSWWKRYTRSSRSKRQSSTTSLCPTSSQFIMPQAALNNKGNWMYIVNLDTDRRYRQLVRSETCVTTQCNGICSLPNGYTSRCEQQFVQKRLVALDRAGDNLYTDLFWLPHCCICQISQNIR
uniref:Secreted Spaetzle-like protein n=1 Tax=Pristhesancus plagipennis TaxID=1955184 RepID=A0A2K8JV54_PRIPG|nr:secreted Spaetzle-like protein [Pristhesancus plagipennis]